MCVHGNFRAMALGWCRSQRRVLRRIKSIKRKDILNMEKTKPSFEDGRKGLFGSGSTSCCQIARPSQIVGCLLFQRLDSQFQSQGPHSDVLRAERCLVYQLLGLFV